MFQTSGQFSVISAQWPVAKAIPRFDFTRLAVAQGKRQTHSEIVILSEVSVCQQPHLVEGSASRSGRSVANSGFPYGSFAEDSGV
jgi:hypothetical protein